MKRFDTKKRKKVFDHNALYLTVLYVSINKKKNVNDEKGKQQQ